MENLKKIRSYIILIVICISITGYYYYPSLDNFFIWDDFWFLMTSRGDIKSILFGLPHLRLFGNILMWINYIFFGLDYYWYNIISVTVHGINLYLIYAVIKKITNDSKLAILSSIIFSLMSVYADAILYKAALLTLTNVTFYCLVILTYLKSDNKKYYYLSLILFFLGMINKEEIASIPFMLLFIDYVCNNKNVLTIKYLKKLVPYIAIVLFYMFVSVLLTKFGFMYQEQFARLSKFRPLHSLFGGFMSFISKPDGIIDLTKVALYLTILAVSIATALYFSNNRKYIFLGIGWVFITFLPQSYSNLTQYQPPYLFNSISRHLYIPSIGAAIATAAILLYSSHCNQLLRNGLIYIFLVCLFAYNCPLVHSRSIVWRNEAEGMRIFLNSIVAYNPKFSEGAYIAVERPMTGRAYMTRAFKAYLGNDINYIDDTAKLNDISYFSSLQSVYYIYNIPYSSEGLVISKIK